MRYVLFQLMSRKPPKPHVSIWFYFISCSTAATFCSITQLHLKIFFYYTSLLYQQYNKRYQKYLHHSQNTLLLLSGRKHTALTPFMSLLTNRYKQESKEECKKHLILRQYAFCMLHRTLMHPHKDVYFIYTDWFF